MGKLPKLKQSSKSQLYFYSFSIISRKKCFRKYSKTLHFSTLSKRHTFFCDKKSQTATFFLNRFSQEKLTFLQVFEYKAQIK